MATNQVSGGGLWFAGLDISGDFNAVSFVYGAEPLDDTTISDTTRTFLGGLKTTQIEGEGYWDATPDSTLFTKVSASNEIVTRSPLATTVGSLAYFVNAKHIEYSPGASIGEVYAFSFSASAVDELVRGQIEYNNTATSTAQSSGVQLGALSTGQKLFAAAHVTAASGSSPTLDLTVESDDNGSFTSATTQATFTQITAVGSQMQTVDGAVTDDYWRFVLTIGGGSPSFDVVLVFGIKTV